MITGESWQQNSCVVRTKYLANRKLLIIWQSNFLTAVDELSTQPELSRQADSSST